MYKFIKKILSPKVAGTITVRFDAIPGWIQERESRARDRLLSESREPMQKIRNAQAQLQHIVNGIAGAEQEPALHPKLKSIAKNSLPLFVRAMTVSLSKELPDDVEAFYPAAVESVKGCLNSTRGQGRYLQIVFPEEMKEVRAGIDAIGRDLNAITGSLGRFRKEQEQLNTAKELCQELHNIRIDLEKSTGKEQRINTRIEETQGRIRGIERELDKLASDERIKEHETIHAALEATGKSRDEATRHYASLSMTASHVFGKAEKIAVKQHHPSEIATLRKTMELLSDHAIPDSHDLAAAISAAIPIAARMIEADEVTLKNKEERSIFSDIPRFLQEIAQACDKIKELEENYQSQELAYGSHPLFLQMNALGREKTQLEVMLGKEQRSREELALWREKTSEKIPILADQLRKKIEDIGGENVQLQTEDPIMMKNSTDKTAGT